MSKSSPSSLLPSVVFSRIQFLLGAESVILRGLSSNEPIVSHGAPVSPKFILDRAASRRVSPPPSFVNDPHGLICSPVDWHVDPFAFTVQPIDYAELCVRREVSQEFNQPLPRVLSANALIVCPEARMLLLHRRALSSATYPGRLHTVGGAYWPAQPRSPSVGPAGDLCLRHTAVREVREEIGLALDIPQSLPILLLEEIPTGFVQAAFLGCSVPSSASSRASGNPEGQVVWVSFDDLPDLLRRSEEWVPTAWASVLVWLALGAPVSGVPVRSDVRFGAHAAQSLADVVTYRAPPAAAW